MLNGKIDLRSDTITPPDAGMRQAMADAIVGDDVLGDDPTVQALEKHVAELMGKQEALYVPSGTMANQLAIRTQTRPGDAMILEANAHIDCYESGAPAALAGVHTRRVTGDRGRFSAKQLEAAIPIKNDHFAQASLVCVENTHNQGGGSIWPLSQIQDVTGTARKHGLALHLDGARLWNASAASGVSLADYAATFDTVSVCFSKGLGAPVGSALLGPSHLIEKARFYRKQQGGAMRQVGILAAAAQYALTHNRDRLAQDHDHCRQLAEGLSEIDGIEVDPEEVETNMLFIETGKHDAATLTQKLDELGIRVLATGPSTLRAVTNLTFQADEVERVIHAFKQVL